MNNSLSINFGSRVFVLPYDTVRAKLEDASSNQLKVLMLLAMDESARSGYPGNADTLAASVGLSKKAFESAVAYWCDAGVFSASANVSAQPVQPSTVQSQTPLTNHASSANQAPAADKPAQTPNAAQVNLTSPSPQSAPKVIEPDDRPHYTDLEIEKLTESRKELKQLIAACGTVLKKMLNHAEITKLVELSDYLRLDDDYILMLCYYCVGLGMGSIPYIYKAAYKFHDDGIVSAAALDEYIKSRERQKDGITKLRTLLGIGDRTLTPKERETFEMWFGSWCMSFEMVERAYQITIEKTENHKMSLPYMNKVLQNWYNSGYKTLDEVDNALAEYRRTHENGTTESSFDTDEFFEAALRRSYGQMESAANQIMSQAQPHENGRSGQ